MRAVAIGIHEAGGKISKDASGKVRLSCVHSRVVHVDYRAVSSEVQIIISTECISRDSHPHPAEIVHMHTRARHFNRLNALQASERRNGAGWRTNAQERSERRPILAHNIHSELLEFVESLLASISKEGDIQR